MSGITNERGGIARRVLRLRPVGRVVAGLLAGLLALPAAGQEAEGFFTLPNTREARTKAETAEQHLSAGRFGLGLEVLQELFESHLAEVLPDSWRLGERYSQFPAHPGAAAWALERLRRLPREAKDLYRSRSEPRARAAYRQALASRDPALFVAVARTWPITDAAEDAWRSLGDLEIERGAVEAARTAWERGHDIARANGRATSPYETRLALAERTLARIRPDAGRQADGSVRGSLPRGDSDRWEQQLDMRPFDRRQGSTIYNVFPVLSQGMVLVNTTLLLYCLDAYTGKVRWKAEPPFSWERIGKEDQNELFAALEKHRVLVAPAVEGNVVVAAMQIPYSDIPTHKWQGIDIMHAIPERRLFAYDLRTGEPLWNHAPPLEWSAINGSYDWPRSEKSFQESMLVAAPPTISQGRVVVPCYRMQGRIDFRVACYESTTGELLWWTPLISGQRERNMFGRARREFVGSPVTIVEDKVVVQTELGAVAALDLFTGGILWESLYEQMALPKTTNFHITSRQETWREAAPVVVDGVVVTTPTDSQDIVGLDLEDGRVLWSHSQSSFLGSGRSQPKHDLLVGADADTVYLAGERVAALQKPGGLRRPGAFQPRWFRDIDSRLSSLLPRTLLGESWLLVPTREDRLVLDRNLGRPETQLSDTWPAGAAGNVAVGDGALFVLNADKLTAFFDWDTLIARKRAELEASPGDDAIALETARLLARRGETTYGTGETSRALSIVDESRSLLEDVLARGADSIDPRALGTLHEVRRLEARIRDDLGDPAGALAALAKALPLANTPEEVRDTLLQEEALLRDESAFRRRHLEVLDELEERCAGLLLPKRSAEEETDLDWLLGEALLPPETFRGWEEATLSVETWVLLARATAKARGGDPAGALEDLHLALARHGRVGLVEGWTVGDVVEQRIARRLELDGREAYAPFERQAADLFRRALREKDEHLLELVPRRFPHSDAGRRAWDTRLTWAHDRDDPGTVARIVYETLQGRDAQDVETARRLLLLGSALERAGNLEFQRGLVRSLARRHPDMRSDLEGDGRRTLAEIAAELGARVPRSVQVEPSFGTTGVSINLPGRFDYLGRMELPEEEAVLHVYLQDGAVHGFSSRAPSKPAWAPFDLTFQPEPEQCALTQTRIVAGGYNSQRKEQLIALDRRGQLAWLAALPERSTSTVRAADGVVVVTIGKSRRVLAFDAHAGNPLWRADLDGYTPPILGEGKAVFFWSRWNERTHARVVDLFSGLTVVDIDLGNADLNVNEAAWVSNGRLFVPDFHDKPESPTGLTAYDLETGRRLWNKAFSDGEQLSSILSHGGRDYLVTLANAIRPGGGSGGIYSLDPELGSVRSIVRLQPGDEVLGADNARHVVLEQPYVFVDERGSSEDVVTIQGIHLPNEHLWHYRLPGVSRSDLYDSPLPIPAVSTECVVLAYSTRRQNRMADETRVDFVDRNGGYRLDGRILRRESTGRVTVTLRGLGDSLFIVSHTPSHRTGRLEILEDDR